MSQELRREMNQVRAVLWGDPDRPDVPGVLAELGTIRASQVTTNQTLTEIRHDIRRVVWLVLTATITAILGMVFVRPHVAPIIEKTPALHRTEGRASLSSNP